MARPGPKVGLHIRPMALAAVASDIRTSSWAIDWEYMSQRNLNLQNWLTMSCRKGSYDCEIASSCSFSYSLIA